MTLFREICRFWRGNRLSVALAIVVLSAGFCAATLTLTVLLGVSSGAPDGLRSMHYATIAEESTGGGSRPVSWTTYQQLVDAGGWTDTALVAYAEPTRATLQNGEIKKQVSVAGVSSGFFSRFSEGLLGQDFSSSLDGSGGAEVILSASLQEKIFSSPADAVGRSVTLNGQTFRIMGIAPKGFTGLWSMTDAWVTPDKMSSLIFGPLRGELPQIPGGNATPPYSAGSWKRIPVFYVLASSGSAQRMHQSLEAFVQDNKNRSYRLHVTEGLSKDPLRDQKVRTWSRLILLLSVALIFAASLNYCGLLLAQAPRRAEEVRLKQVLGAGVMRILTENISGPAFTVIAGFVLATSGASAGVWIIKAEGARYLPQIVIAWHTLYAVLGVEFALACMLALVVALVPALRLLRDSGAPRMGYTSTTNRKVKFILQGIAATQIASCIVIGLVAAMILSAVHSMSQEALGFDGDHLAAIEIGPASRDANLDFRVSEQRDFPLALFARELLRHTAENFPEVRYAAIASCAPFGQPMKTLKIERVDRPSETARSVRFCGATQGFFQAMRNPIIEGSVFSSGNLTGRVSEAVINDQLAQELWPGESPLHRTIRIEQTDLEIQFLAEVVGVSQNMRLSGVASTPDATVFVPLQGSVFELSLPLYFLAKGALPPPNLEALVNQQAAMFMPSLGANASYRLDEKLQSSFMEQKGQVYLAICGAVLVALIAYIGLYGVLIHFVNTRRREMAIRLCFGASIWDLRKAVVLQAAECALVAAVLSLLSWLTFARVIFSQWLGRASWSWHMALPIPLACVLLAMLLSILPANATTKVSPVEILKEQ